MGYAEALKHFPYTCFVFHDVDLIPEDDRISYGCKQSPMHMSVAIDKVSIILNELHNSNLSIVIVHKNTENVPEIFLTVSN